MIKLGHNDDKKGKWQSHTIQFRREDDYENFKMGIYCYDPFDIFGCGATKEEALENFMEKFKYLMNELRTLEEMVLNPEIDIVEVDCFGKEIK